MLVFLSDTLIATLFFHGEMTRRDVDMSGMALAAYGVGLLGHMLVKVLAPGYFARQDTSTPVRYGVIALGSNMLLNMLLIWHLKHAGLALATSISAFINAALLFYGLRKSGVLVLEAGWSRFLGQVLLANIVMLLALYLITPVISMWFEFGLVERIVIMLLICLVGALTYAGCLRITGVTVGQFVR